MPVSQGQYINNLSLPRFEAPPSSSHALSPIILVFELQTLNSLSQLEASSIKTSQEITGLICSHVITPHYSNHSSYSMGLRVALLSRIITFIYTSSIKTNGKMFHSASSPATGKVNGSSRLHARVQKLPIVPPSNLISPIPTRAGVHRVLGYRSRRHTKNPSPYRRRHPTSQISAVNIDGTYDDDHMCDMSVQSVESISPTETGYARYQHIKREHTPYTHESSICTIADIKDKPNGTDYLLPLYKYHSFDLAFPLPIEYDNASLEQRECLDRRPVEYLMLAAIGTPQTRQQIQALSCPRVCIDSDATIVDRFVTDCEKTSGRVYDRLFRREVPRIIPYASSSFLRAIPSRVFDVYTGEIRKRCLFDDLRDSNARSEGNLDIIKYERDLDYDEVPDYSSSESVGSNSAEEDNVEPYEYDADQY